MVVRQISPSYGAPRTAAPIVIRQSAPATRHKRRSHFRGRGKTKGMGLNQTIMGAAVAGGLIGLAEKTGLLDKLPTIPIVGRKGALAIAAYFWAKHGGGQMARDVAIAAATMSAYQLGKEGTISGDDY
jgi:hypothetical protein